MTQEEALALMRQAGALEEGHFLMKSGRHADLFLQCAHLIEHADITGQLCQELAERCRDCGCDLVIAPALGASSSATRSAAHWASISFTASARTRS